MSDDCAIQLLNHTGKHRQGRIGGVLVRENAIGAFLPRLNGGIYGFLNVGAVEVDCGPSRGIFKGTRKAENVPEQGARCGDLIYVEAGIYREDCEENVIPKVAARCSVVGGVREKAFGREDEVFIEERCIATGVGAFVDVFFEGAIEGEKRGKIISIGNSGY